MALSRQTQAGLYWARKRNREMYWGDTVPPNPDPLPPEPGAAVNGLFLGSKSLVRTGTEYQFTDCRLGPPGDGRTIAVFCYMADVILGAPVVKLDGVVMPPDPTMSRITVGGHQVSLHMLQMEDGETAYFDITAPDTAQVCGIQWLRLSGFNETTGKVVTAVNNNAGGNASFTDTLAGGEMLILAGLAAKTASGVPAWDADVNEQDTIHIAGGTYMTLASRRSPPYALGAVTADMTSNGTGASILGLKLSP